MKLTVSAIAHKDVRGKELLYLKMETTTGKEVVINVGKATYEAVGELVKEEQKQAGRPMGTQTT